MNISLLIAKKYFFSRRITRAIHLISGISMLGVLVGSAALIIILSVFNGFQSTVLSLYNSFDSEIKITPARGKYFALSDDSLVMMRNLNYVGNLSPVIEENVLIRYREKQTLARIKGMDTGYIRANGIDSMVFVGESKLMRGDVPMAILGAGISEKLSVNVYDERSPLKLFVPKAGKRIILNPRKAFSEKSMLPGGIFSIQKEFDDKYIIVPLDFARLLCEKPTSYSSIEINPQSPEMAENLKLAVIAFLQGRNLVIQDRFEQHRFFYNIMQSEKGAVYLILSFVLLIAAFNLIGSLTMMAIEKRKDAAILLSMGADEIMIRKIFLYQGLMLSLTGAVLGLGLGTLICWLQQIFGFVQMGDGTFVTDVYPVVFNGIDHVVVFFTVAVIGFIASYFPAKMSANQLFKQKIKIMQATD